MFYMQGQFLSAIILQLMFHSFFTTIETYILFTRKLKLAFFHTEIRKSYFKCKCEISSLRLLNHEISRSIKNFEFGTWNFGFHIKILSLDILSSDAKFLMQTWNKSLKHEISSWNRNFLFNFRFQLEFLSLKYKIFTEFQNFLIQAWI